LIAQSSLYERSQAMSFVDVQYNLMKAPLVDVQYNLLKTAGYDENQIAKMQADPQLLASVLKYATVSSKLPDDFPTSTLDDPEGFQSESSPSTTGPSEAFADGPPDEKNFVFGSYIEEAISYPVDLLKESDSTLSRTRPHTVQIGTLQFFGPSKAIQ
jgi:hypothetical protein